jgi:Zn-dependent protease with chaperone function
MAASAFRSRPRRTAAAVLLATLFLARAAVAAPPDTEFEKLLGKPVAWGLVETSGAETDPLLLNWVRAMGAKVAAQAPRQDLRYTFQILGSDAPNALAAPGGYVFVTRGLLDFVESDDELASVLAHEAAHVSKKHALQQIEANLLFYGVLGRVKFGGSDDWKTAASLLNVLRSLHKSREMEAQADELGIAFAARAGYDPAGLAAFFERLAATRSEPGRLARFFATHPSPRNRLETTRRDPLVRPTDDARRQALADAYAARGLFGAASRARAGEDPLALPLNRRTSPESSLTADGRLVARGVGDIARALSASYKAQRVGGGLQQVALVNDPLGDYRRFYVILRAYAVQNRAADVYERSVRVLRAAPETLERLAALPPGEDAARGHHEVKAALNLLNDAPRPLARASQATLAALADVNNVLYRPEGAGAWVRYGSLEGLLRYAESELARADRASGLAWRVLSLARVRAFQGRITELALKDDGRARWADLLARRVGATPPDADRAAGDLSIQTALAVQLGNPPDEIARGRGEIPWADWILERRGVPENVATALRLLTLDLERETAASDQRADGTAPRDTAGADGDDEDGSVGAGRVGVRGGPPERRAALAGRGAKPPGRDHPRLHGTP